MSPQLEVADGPCEVLLSEHQCHHLRQLLRSGTKTLYSSGDSHKKNTMQWRIPHFSRRCSHMFTHHFQFSYFSSVISQPSLTRQVVDSADPDRIGDSKEELRLMLEEEELKGVTLLVLANKQDPFRRTWQQKCNKNNLWYLKTIWHL